MPRHGSSLTVAARRLISHSARHCSRRRSLSAAVFYSFLVSEPRFGSSAPATIDHTRSEGTVEFLKSSHRIPKIETDKFDGKSDFVMWRKKMKAVLRWIISFRC
ncbi:hypothetical protein M9H77_34764 [Catharanthus roseus]|uniref:Uncharacterized protein n=1 Tax=Catharanthus roseus TaxID=4058 RepID=A0ACB9ZN06_CATRO|nr:hypothetical protein M9H77_34764 [Catharanthus roseus]